MNFEDIKGLGKSRIASLKKAGFFSPADLVMYFPKNYIDFNKKIDFSQMNDAEDVVFLGTVVSLPIKKFIRRGLSFVKVDFSVHGVSVGASSQKIITCTWFNQPFIAKRLIMDKEFYVSGKVKKFKNKVEISSPVLYDKDEFNIGIEPIYKSIKGVSSQTIKQAIEQTLNSITINSILPPDIIKKYNIQNLNDALKNIHFPKRIEDVTSSYLSLSLEKLSCDLALFQLLKLSSNSKRSRFIYKNKISQLNDFIDSLPYQLTDCQKNAIDDTIKSMLSNDIESRLIQGDVGCGKTIVAFICMYFAYLNGYQSVLMAPTEILARQHYRLAIKLFESLGARVEFLAGSQTPIERQTSLFNIKNGMANFIIGTHALIEDSVVFNNLSLIVCDEQQRFGVSQRAKLENKSVGADTIVLSATPIPRTLALTFYGDLHQSQIMQLPKDKAKTLTRFVRREKEQDMLEYLVSILKKGEQVYIVCPRINEEADESNLVSVEEIYKNIKNIFNDYSIAMVHGKMNEKDKQSIMTEFYANRINLLISTTVIEVGIDVQNATQIVIYNAERYGLSQLHQLRGRVGRGKSDSFCFVLSDNTSKETLDRLKTFCDITNGFELAEYDFLNRGAGDFLGTKQHGDFSSNSYVKITKELLEEVKDIADELIKHNSFVNNIKESLTQEKYNYIKSITLN